jgi:hypothetical protein
MATRNSTTARTFTPIDLGNGKVITPVRAEFGTMQFRATYHGELIAVEATETEAHNRLNENLVVLSSPFLRLILYPRRWRPCTTCPHQAVTGADCRQAIIAVPRGVDSSCRVVIKGPS